MITLLVSFLAVAVVGSFLLAFAWEVRKQIVGGSHFVAVVLADSINAETLSRLTTFRLTYPRYVHAEFMTHRQLARCASSSRAIPSARMRAMIRAQMALPYRWGENKPGMQAGHEVSSLVFWIGAAIWIGLGHVSLFASFLLDKLGLHKQIVNRIVEPWAHITVVATGEGSGWANFYALRDHKDADPTIQKLARVMLAAHKLSRPRLLQVGEWHLPYVTEVERDDVKDRGMGALVRASAARAARTSYLNSDGTTPILAKDLALYQRLVGSDPKHASPTEHQARVLTQEESRQSPRLAGCFGPGSGWCQHRKEIENEAETDLGRFLRDA